MTLLCTCSRRAQTAPISRRTASGSTAISNSRLSSNKAWQWRRHGLAMASSSTGADWRKSRHRSERLAQAARINSNPLLAEASVDLEALARNALALVGRQEQRQTCDVVGRHRIGNSLTRANFSDLLLVREPEPALALGEHHAGRDGVDANAVGSDQPSQGVGEDG